MQSQSPIPKELLQSVVQSCDQTHAYLFAHNGHTWQAIELDIVSPTIGQKAIDIGNLFPKHHWLTLDPGFKSTASCQSAITYIDGDEGKLLYRGYPIEKLASIYDFIDIVHLLWFGRLPCDEKEKHHFLNEIKSHTMVHEQIKFFFHGFPRNAHPMAMLCGIIGGLSAFYHDNLDIHNQEDRYLSMLRLVAKVPTLAAMIYRYRLGLPFIEPQNNLSFSENILRMFFSFPSEPYHVSKAAIEAFEMILILHADHEQNASTSTVRMAGSSLANPFACMAGGIAALWGPSHGGANQEVIACLLEIGSVDAVDDFIEKVKRKERLLMGFGHRVYKNFDPRAQIIKNLYEKLMTDGQLQHDPLFEIAQKLEQIALNDPYFIERKLYPNVDFYSGLILRKIGFPTEMFTVIFVMARMIGWITHWNEMITDPKMVIARPRQVYKGLVQE